MEVAEFRRILRIGLGRAIIYLQNHSSTPYRDVILEACLENTCYDPQVEGDRTPYLLEILDLTGEFEFYREQILKKFAATTPSNDWDVSQYSDFVYHLAERGDNEARRLLYDKFKESWNRGDGSYEIVDLDGVKGLLFVMDPFGNEITFTDVAWKYEYLLSRLEYKRGKEETRRTLLDASKDKMRVQSFLNAVDVYRKQSKGYAKERRKEEKVFAAMPYEDLKESIIEHGRKSSQFGWWRWGESASDEDLRKAADDLIHERNPQLLFSYLKIFQHRQFPLDFSRLIYLAQHDDTHIERDRIAISAINALENIKHSDVRALALKMIEEGNRVGRAVGLLQRNFVDGDWKLLESISARELEQEDYHSLGMSIEDIFKLNPSPDAAVTFLKLYEHGPCSQCRRRFIEILHSLNALPPDLAQECRFDANADLREFVENGFMYRE